MLCCDTSHIFAEVVIGSFVTERSKSYLRTNSFVMFVNVYSMGVFLSLDVK